MDEYYYYAIEPGYRARTFRHAGLGKTKTEMFLLGAHRIATTAQKRISEYRPPHATAAAAVARPLQPDGQQQEGREKERKKGKKKGDWEIADVWHLRA